MPRFLSFDISTANTGWCFYDGVSHFKMGIISFGKMKSLADKFLHLHNESGRIIDELKPDAVVVEGVFAFKNIKTTKTLSEAGGMVKLNCYKRGIPVDIVENTTVKAFFKTRKKEDLYKVMISLTGLDTLDLNYDKYNDMIDSFALLLYYMAVIAKRITIKDDVGINFKRLCNVN